jgi:hypothetical protein
MEDLNELGQLITWEGQQMYPLMAWPVAPPDPATKEQRLFCGIQAGSFQTDDQAAEAIYGTDAKNKRYVALKAKVKRKMMHHLFFLTFEKAGTRPGNALEQECMKLLFFAKMLRKKGSLEFAGKTAARLVGVADKSGFNALVLEGLEELQLIYVQQHEPSHYQKIVEKLAHYRTLVNQEREANDLYLGIKLCLKHSAKQRPALLPQLELTINRLEGFWQRTQSFVIYEQWYKLRLWYLELTNDFEQIIQLTDQAPDLCQEEEAYKTRFDHRFNKHMKVYAYLRTGQYEVGLQHAQMYLRSFSQSDRNWFTFTENYLLLALYLKKYELAQSLMIDVVLSPHHQKLPPLAKERWTIYRAYLYFLQPPAQVDLKFDFNAFIAQLPHYRQDKAGFNIAILVLQFLYYLKKDDLDSLLYRVKALNDYAAKHLRSQLSERTRTLFKLFRVLADNYHLNARQMRYRCRYLTERLASLPASGYGYADIEIIPYEHLWEMCLDNLAIHEKKAVKGTAFTHLAGSQWD